MDWTWTRVFAMVSGLLGISFNLTLVPIILWRSSSQIGSYKYLLLFYTLDAALYSLTQVLTLPTFYVSERGLLFYQQLPLFSRIPGTIIIFCFVYTHAMVVLVLTLCFIYRYLVIANPQALSWYKQPHKALAVYGSALLTAFYLVFTAVFALWPTDEADNIFREPAFEHTGRVIEEMAYIGAAVIINGRSNPKMVLCMWSFAAMVVSCTSIIVLCIIGIVRKLKTSMGMVKRAQNYNKRLFWLLLSQTLLPFAFTFTPPLAAWLLGLFQVTIGESIGIFGDIMTFAQVLDPLLVFYFIAEYRRAFLSFVFGRKYASSFVAPTDEKSRSTAGLKNSSRR